MTGNTPPFFAILKNGASSGNPSPFYVDLFNAQTVAGAKTWTGAQTYTGNLGQLLLGTANQSGRLLFIRGSDSANQGFVGYDNTSGSTLSFGTSGSNSVSLKVSGTSYLTVNTNGIVQTSAGIAVKTSTRLTSPQTLTVSDCIVGTNLTIAGAVSAVLPAASSNAGQRFTVKDEKGDAGTNNITITVTGGGTIDGAASKVISTNYGFVHVYSNGTAYFTE